MKKTQLTYEVNNTATSNCKHSNVSNSDYHRPVSNAAFPHVRYNQRLTGCPISRTYRASVIIINKLRSQHQQISNHTEIHPSTNTQQMLSSTI